MLCESIVKQLFSPRATEVERTRAMRKLIQIRPGYGGDDGELHASVASMLMDMGVHTAWESWWGRIVKLYEVPSHAFPTMRLDARTILLGIPPWESAERRFIPNLLHAKKRAAESGTEIFVDDEEERYCRMFDRARLEFDLRVERDTLAWYQEHRKDKLPDGRPTWEATAESCAARVVELEAKLAEMNDGPVVEVGNAAG